MLARGPQASVSSPTRGWLLMGGVLLHTGCVAGGRGRPRSAGERPHNTCQAVRATDHGLRLQESPLPGHAARNIDNTVSETMPLLFRMTAPPTRL